MSASNWAICPRCLAEARAAAAEEHAAVMALYGTVSVEEFDAKRSTLREVDPEDFRTLREDYEFHGAELGKVVASYYCCCGTCKLEAELNASKRFWQAS